MKGNYHELGNDNGFNEIGSGDVARGMPGASARARGLAICILSRHPLHTSARKAHLYSSRELFAFQLKTLLTGGRNLRSADGSNLWYDGRR